MMRPEALCTAYISTDNHFALCLPISHVDFVILSTIVSKPSKLAVKTRDSSAMIACRLSIN